MRRRFLISVGVLTVPIAVALLATVPAAGQTQAPAAKTNGAAAKAYTPPRTPDGQPDFQGFWTNSTYTPLERPNNVNKEFYTPAEAAEAEKRAADREAEQTEPGTIADVHYDFTQFGLDKSQSAFARSLRTSQIVDPPNGKLPPLNAEGQKRAAERAAARKMAGGQYDRVENMPIGSRCIIMAGSGPPMQNTGYNNNFQIVQGPGYVMILVEMIHDARIVALDGRAAPPKNVRQWMGVSRGRWEGNTLVVETTNFNGKTAFRGATENMRVTERFTRVSENNMQYRFTVEDPSTWDQAWTAEMPIQKTDGPMFEHACHEANYSIANILAGAREDDKKAATAAAKKSTN